MASIDIVIFDLDGVIIDSASVVRMAYERAGANPPNNILGQEGTGWLEDQLGPEFAPKVYARKNEIYRELIQRGQAPLLSGFYTAQKLMTQGYYVMLLTGAPTGTIDAMKRWVGVHSWPFDGAWDNTRTPEKMILMRKLALSGKTGVYIDDQDRFIDTPVSWKFIHYTQQNAETLYKDITSW